jgi:hypothetical protein
VTSGSEEVNRDAPRLRKPRSPRVRPPADPRTDLDPLTHYPQEEPSLLRNPYVLAGLAVAASIVFAVMVVVLFGGNGESDASPGASDDSVVVEPLTPVAGGRGVSARSIAAATVRDGPGTEFPEIAPLRTGQDIEVVGRNQASTWFQIYYPSGSDLKGWVPGSALRLPEGGTEKVAVVIATPVPRPTIALPSPTPEPPGTPTATPTVPVSPSPAPPIDLALSIGSCLSGAALVVNVVNVGQAPVINRQVRITVASLSGILGVADSVVSLQPGGSLGVSTNQAVQPMRMVARIDLIGAPLDGNGANNVAECVPSATQPLPGR